MRISFSGDDGCIERLDVVSNDSESSAVTIEEISADSSGRSFLLKCPGSQVLYFWCSEKSKLHGMELLAKVFTPFMGQMKDLLRKKPSLSHLTGICESRLDSFANHLRGYLGSSNTSKAISAEPAISSAIAPLLPTYASPIIPETESVVEKSARETLRMLMTPASGSPRLMTMLPHVLNSSADQGSKHGTVAAVSRCLYTGTMDVDAATGGVFFMELSLSRQKLAQGSSTTARDKHGDLESPQFSDGLSCAMGEDLLDQQISD